MYSLTTLIVTGLIGLLVGASLGALVLYIFRQQLLGQDLEQRLHQAESELQAYQRNVAEHFAQTSSLVNNLTQAYRDVHEHLANGALKLATPAISRQIIDSANASDTGNKAYLGEQTIAPPRDWAPKSPGSKGTLSEDFGLRDDDPHAPPVATESAEDFDDYENRTQRYS